MHEIALHHDHNIDDFGAPYRESDNRTTSRAGFVTANHIDGLTTCLQSTHKILDSYLAFDLTSIRSLPNLYLVWSVYALVALIKFHGIVHGPDAQYVSVFASDLRVDHYLDAMSQKVAQAAEGGRCDAFGFVIKKLKTWFTHRKSPYSVKEIIPENDADFQLSGAGKQGFGILMESLEESPRPNPNGNANSLHLSDRIPDTEFNPYNGMSSDLNAAYDAATYEGTDWDQVDLSANELNAFDYFMNNTGGMGYFL